MEHSPDSPFTPEIFEEWDRLISPEILARPLDEQRDLWRKLYAPHRNDLGWTISAPDARLIADVGITISLRSGDYVLARDLAYQWLTHTDVSLCPYFEIDIGHFQTRLCVAGILNGEVDGALDLMRRSLAEQPFSYKYELLVRAELPCLFECLGLDEPVDHRIASFVSELVGMFPGADSASADALNARSYHDLANAVKMTYPNDGAAAK